MSCKITICYYVNVSFNNNVSFINNVSFYRYCVFKTVTLSFPKRWDPFSILPIRPFLLP